MNPYLAALEAAGVLIAWIFGPAIAVVVIVAATVWSRR